MLRDFIYLDTNAENFYTKRRDGVDIGRFKLARSVVTEDGKLSAHHENTCVVRDGFQEILTLMNGEEIWQKTIQ